MGKIKFADAFSSLRPHILFDRAFAGFTRIAAHEADSLDGHWLALRERVSLARKARGVGEMLRDQIDLLPETRNRVMHDHRVRKALWRGLAQTLRQREDGSPA